MQKRVDFTIEIVKDAGKKIRRLMSEKIEIKTKTNDKDFVTNVDKQTEIYLVERIQKEYANQDFLTEEDTIGRTKSDDLWIIDPIDGTTNFIYQGKNFAISVAYYHKKKPIFGIVYDVMADELFVGITGQGARFNGEKLEKLDQTKRLKESIVNVNLSSLKYFKNGTQNLIDSVISHRYLGSAALEICMLAKNETSAYITDILNAWDIAAAVIILKEVGGTFLIGDKQNEIYLSDKKDFFIASKNEIIHQELLNLINYNAN